MASLEWNDAIDVRTTDRLAQSRYAMQSNFGMKPVHNFVGDCQLPRRRTNFQSCAICANTLPVIECKASDERSIAKHRDDPFEERLWFKRLAAFSCDYIGHSGLASLTNDLVPAKHRRERDFAL